MRRIILIGFTGLGLAAITGCQGVEWPRLFSWKASPRVQRSEAAYWDPYPKNDMQDVSMNDTRPRDFDRPMSEVKRTQMSPYTPYSPQAIQKQQ